jgi:hypothetical protein
MEGVEMSDTPISDSTPHNVAELGMLCRRLERELTASNTIIRQQQLLDEANLRLQERIKRLEQAGDAVEERLGCGCGCGGPCRVCQSASGNWFEAKEAKP